MSKATSQHVVLHLNVHLHEYINDKFCLDVFVQVLQFDEITKRYLFVITVSNVQTSQKYIYQM